MAVNYLRNGEAANEVVQACRLAGGDAFAVQADVTQPAEVARLVERVVDEAGRIDVLVNNAFRSYAFDPEQRRTFGELGLGRLRGAVRGLGGRRLQPVPRRAAAVPARAQGSIVNIVSNLVENPVVPYHEYTTAKAALVGFSRNLASELGPLGVRVNCVAPGLVYPTEGSGGTRAVPRDS